MSTIQASVAKSLGEKLWEEKKSRSSAFHRGGMCWFSGRQLARQRLTSEFRNVGTNGCAIRHEVGRGKLDVLVRPLRIINGPLDCGRMGTGRQDRRKQEA